MVIFRKTSEIFENSAARLFCYHIFSFLWLFMKKIAGIGSFEQNEMDDGKIFNSFKNLENFNPLIHKKKK